MIERGRHLPQLARCGRAGAGPGRVAARGRCPGRPDWALDAGHRTTSTARSSACTSPPLAPSGGEALGRSRVSLSTKVHVRCDRAGWPLCFHLIGGEAARHKVILHPLDCWPVRRAGPGRPRRRPERLAGNRGCSGRHVRGDLRRRRIAAVIPQPRGGQPCFPLDPAACRERNAAERLVGRLQQFRRLATRYEKRAASYPAMLQLTAILLRLRERERDLSTTLAGLAWTGMG